MTMVTVYTKQHIDALRGLEKTGRHVACIDYIRRDMEDTAPLVLPVYDWLVRHSPAVAQRPADVVYPVWVSYAQEAAMLPGPGFAIWELELEESLITPVNIAKWGAILNYSYIPADAADAARHQQRMAEYGIGDAAAVMSRFYPQLKQEIIASWDRLFDDNIRLGNAAVYGTVWEVQRDWLRRVIYGHDRI